MRIPPAWLWVLGLGLTRVSPVFAAPPVEEPVAPAHAEAPAPDPAEAEHDELPAYDAELPRYEEAPPVVEDASAPSFEAGVEAPPASGHGRLVVGGILLGGGATLVAISSALIAEGIDVAAWIPGAVVGSAALAGGLGLTIAGHVDRKRYTTWAELHGGRGALPPPGTGLLAGGILCMAAGGFGAFLGGLSLTLQDEDDPPYGEVMLPLAATSAATGVALLIVGVKRRRAYREWGELQLAPSVALLPGPRRAPGGLSLGLAGRF